MRDGIGETDLERLGRQPLGEGESRPLITKYPDAERRRALNFGIADFLLKDFDAFAERVIADDVKRLRCFEQVFNEAMRIRPPFPLLVRSVAEDTVLNGIFYPKGAAILLMIGAVHVDSRYWGPHPDRFDPEHFSPENEAQRTPNAFAPFGIGPRLCVGNRFTMMEAAMLVVPLLRQFDFELIPDQNVQPFLRTSWSTRNGIRFKVHQKR